MIDLLRMDDCGAVVTGRGRAMAKEIAKTLAGLGAGVCRA